MKCSRCGAEGEPDEAADWRQVELRISDALKSETRHRIYDLFCPQCSAEVEALIERGGARAQEGTTKH